MYRPLSIGLILVSLAAPVFAQAVSASADADALAVKIAGDGTVLDRTRRLVTWINHDFEWIATDYQQRTPEQIIERRAGNCADLAKVLARLLDAVHVRYRFVREINVEPASDSRQTNAEKKIAASGARFSVFGRQHNDHTWLEVSEADSGSWTPADPAVGVVGIDEWINARLAFENRRQPAVAAVVPTVRAMLVPFAIVAAMTEDRSAYYLIDEFDRAYGGSLKSLPAWTQWCSLVRELGPLSMRAFTGEVNLHDHADAIVRAADTYDALRHQADGANVTLK